MGEMMSSRWSVLALLSISLLFVISSTPLGSAQNQVAYDGPGSDFSYPAEHRLFLKGDEDSQFLDRNWTTVTGLPSGSVSFSKTSTLSSPTIIDASAPSLHEPFRFEGNITVRLSLLLRPLARPAQLPMSLGGRFLVPRPNSSSLFRWAASRSFQAYRQSPSS